MKLCEILINSLIGLLTGATSGIIITVWFRHIDKEREKSKYLFALYKYIYSIIKPLSNIEEESNIKELYEIITNPTGREPYFWFTKEEKYIINQFDQSFISILKPIVDVYIWSENKKDKKFYAQRKDYVDSIIEPNIEKLKNIDTEQLEQLAQKIINRKQSCSTRYFTRIIKTLRR